MNRHLKIVKDQDHTKTLIEVLKEFNRQDALECEHGEETQYKYNNFTDNFTRYLQSTGQEEMPIYEASMPLLKYFVLWLPENLKSCGRTHIAKHVARINKGLDYAVQMGYIPYNPSAAYKVKRSKTKPVINLEDNEFLIWQQAEWKTKVYVQAQDNYTFQMVTGLSYIDLFNYKTVNDKNTGLWIEGLRGKTKRPFAIPLYHQEFETARKLHEKYNGEMPYIENHFYNRLIREMAAQLGIEKYLTTHTGRKTFASLKDQNGWNIEPISAMMGNTAKICLTHYISFSKKKILTELKRRA